MKLFFRKEGHGPALLIMHGLFGMSDNWRSIANKLQEHFTVYLIDMRNHGRSPHSDKFDYKTMSMDILELLDDEEIDKAILLGHSMGGKTAMQFSINYPGRVSHLIVADISPRKYSNHEQHLWLIDTMMSVNTQKAASRSQVAAEMAEKIMPDHVRQFLMKNLYWKEKGKLAWRLNLEVIRRNLSEVFRDIESSEPLRLPVLFLKGEKSGYIKSADEHMIRQMFPRAEIITIKNGSHWLHADNPEDFYQQVVAFLQNQ